MDYKLVDIIEALQSTFDMLDGSNLDRILHDTDNLPEKRVYSLALYALDLQDELRLRLETCHLILAYHFICKCAQLSS
jgi:hypothetical protein